METFDTVPLVTAIQSCFNKTADLRYNDGDRNGFLILGMRLRGELISLLSARFNAGTPELGIAATSLKDVNAKLADDAQTLANTAQVIKDVSALVQTLTTLLTTAARFI